MLYSLRGKLIHMEQGIAVVECGGVGYKCQTTSGTQRSIKLGEEVTLYTYLNVREDAIDLYAFSSLAELSTFKMLISVNGVGPKAGLAILSVLSPQQTALAIATKDAKAISMAQGVGNKIAQRIILELKDKLTNQGGADTFATVGGEEAYSSGNYAKAAEALSVLGYSSADISQTLYSLDPSLPVETLIGETLKKMGGNV